MFREATRLMIKMRELLGKVTLQPASSDITYNMLQYYSDKVSYWDRANMDSRKVIFPHLYAFEKVFPIPSSPQDFKTLQEFSKLLDQL